jgi:lysophospholipid acyltransferase (LPLAT)-like uncharacterized protein
VNDKQESASTPPARTAAEAGAGSAYSTASKRRYGPGRKVLFAVATPLAHAFLRALGATVAIRVRSAPDAPGALDELRALASAGGACLPCFWHRHLLPAAGFLLAERRRGLRACWLISPSLDAEVPARLARRFGFAVVRGSGTRTGLRALLGLRRAVVDERASAVLTPDGPKGPPEVARAGPVKLAQITGAPMLPLGLRVRGAVRLGTWDRLELPLPFARIDVVVGPLIRVAADADADGLEAGRQALERTLRALDAAPG